MVARPLHITGNKIKDDLNRDVRLMGVNVMGMEYSCMNGQGFLDKAAGFPANATTCNGLKSWGINCVRLCINEHCFVGATQGGEVHSVTQTSYRSSLKSYVDTFIANDLWVVLDLQWTGMAGTNARDLDGMPNNSYSEQFWTEMSGIFGTHVAPGGSLPAGAYGAVIFDLFNEPRPNNNPNDDTDAVAKPMWECWRDGAPFCTVNAGAPNRVSLANIVGMQALVNAVRATPAQNLIVLGGPRWANTVYSSASRNMNIYKPVDPLAQLIASVHVYNDSWVNGPVGAAAEYAQVASQMPLIAGEYGDRGNNANTSSVNPLAQWLLDNACGGLAWAWEPPAGGSLNMLSTSTSYAAGTPSPYGQGIKDWMIAHPYVPSGGGGTAYDDAGARFRLNGPTQAYDDSGSRFRLNGPTQAWRDLASRFLLVVPSGQPFRDTVLARSPLLYARLGESVLGTVADDSPNARSGTHGGSPTLAVSSLITDPNPALRLNGADYVTWPGTPFEFAGQAPFSLMLIFKPITVDTGFRRIISHENAGITDGYNVFYHSTQGIRFQRKVANAGPTLIGPVPVAGTRYFICATYDGTNVRLYNGKTLAAGPTADSGVLPTLGVSLDLGRRSTALADFTIADVDEFAVFGAALSAADISDLVDAMDYAGGAGGAPLRKFMAGVRFSPGKRPRQSVGVW